MNKETIVVFFELLRIGLGTQECSSIDVKLKESKDAIEWDEIFREGVRQGVVAFLLDGLQRLQENGNASGLLVPKSVVLKLHSHTMQVEERHKKHVTVIQKLAQFYASHGIRMMVLKGYGLSTLYPQPSHRPCGDIDIWLFGEQDRADRLLNEKKGVEIDYTHHHHTVFHINGVMIENHYDFLNIHAHLSSRDIEKELQMLARQEPEKLLLQDNNTIYLPSADLNALFLLRHAGAHFAAEEITLRHVADWAFFVQHYHDKIDWHRLEQTARRQNMHRFLYCLCGICVDYLGMPKRIFPLIEDAVLREGNVDTAAISSKSGTVRDMLLEKRVMDDILDPPYRDRSALRRSFFVDYSFRLRRWWGNRWKHRLVYREGLLLTFLVQIRHHIIKPEGKRV